MPLLTLVIQSCLAGALAQSAAMESPATPASSPAPCTSCDCRIQTACPPAVAWWAIPSDRYYYISRVGGGCPCRLVADAPTPCEGTWGWDYVGRWFHPRVLLGWWHGLAYQGGAGAYQTEGPTLNHGAGSVRALVDH